MLKKNIFSSPLFEWCNFEKFYRKYPKETNMFSINQDL